MGPRRAPGPTRGRTRGGTRGRGLSRGGRGASRSAALAAANAAISNVLNPVSGGLPGTTVGGAPIAGQNPAPISASAAPTSGGNSNRANAPVTRRRINHVATAASTADQNKLKEQAEKDLSDLVKYLHENERIFVEVDRSSFSEDPELEERLQALLNSRNLKLSKIKSFLENLPKYLSCLQPQLPNRAAELLTNYIQVLTEITESEDLSVQWSTLSKRVPTLFGVKRDDSTAATLSQSGSSRDDRLFLRKRGTKNRSSVDHEKNNTDGANSSSFEFTDPESDNENADGTALTHRFRQLQLNSVERQQRVKNQLKEELKLFHPHIRNELCRAGTNRRTDIDPKNLQKYLQTHVLKDTNGKTLFGGNSLTASDPNGADIERRTIFDTWRSLRQLHLAPTDVISYKTKITACLLCLKDEAYDIAYKYADKDNKEGYFRLWMDLFRQFGDFGDEGRLCNQAIENVQLNSHSMPDIYKFIHKIWGYLYKLDTLGEDTNVPGIIAWRKVLRSIPFSVADRYRQTIPDYYKLYKENDERYYGTKPFETFRTLVEFLQVQYQYYIRGGSHGTEIVPLTNYRSAASDVAPTTPAATSSAESAATSTPAQQGTKRPASSEDEPDTSSREQNKRAKTENKNSQGGFRRDQNFRRSVCIFCDKETNHLSQDCRRSLNDRKQIFKDKKLCFRCGKAENHVSPNCPYNDQCDHCDGNHHVAVCNKYFRNKFRNQSFKTFSKQGNSSQSQKDSNSQKSAESDAVAHTTNSSSENQNSDLKSSALTNGLDPSQLSLMQMQMQAMSMIMRDLSELRTQIRNDTREPTVQHPPAPAAIMAPPPSSSAATS